MNRRGPAGRNRGQLVVVAALVLSTILVGLALVLNSGIYAENLATRQTVDTSDVATSVEQVHSETSRTMTVVNQAGFETHTEANASFDTAVANWSVAMSEYQARRGQAFDVEVVDRSMGNRLAQNDSGRNFTSTGGDADWLLVSDAEELAGFRMALDNESLYDGGTLLDEEGFYVEIDNGSHQWRVYAIEDGGDVVVFGGMESGISVDDIGDLGPDEECRAPGDTVTVDVPARTVGGEHCDALAFDDALTGSVSVTFNNTNESRTGGTWELLVPDGATVESTNLGDPWAQPHESAALYDATVRVTYERSDLEHERSRPVVAEPRAYVADN